MDFKISLAHDYAENKSLDASRVAEFVENFKATATNDDIRKAFAASLSIPILKSIPVQSSVRDIFAVDVIPAGSLAEYPIDMEGIETAVVMPRIGAVPQNLVVGESLIVPTFEVANSVEWKLSFVRDGRFNVVERALQHLAESFVKLEEQAGWDVIRASIDSSNTLTHSETTLSKKLFNHLITEFNAEGLNPSVVYASPRRVRDIREWTVTEIDPVTQREIFVNGGMGGIWNVQIRELRSLSDNEVYLFDTSRFGVMPIRSQLQTYDIPDAINRLRAGVGAWEEIGFAALDKRGVMKAAF